MFSKKASKKFLFIEINKLAQFLSVFQLFAKNNA